MVKFISIIIFILAFCFVSFAQEQKPKNGGVGMGMGRGQGSGDGKSTQDNKGIENAQNENNLFIISNPRANYTDRARQKNVSGRVLLRVTFQSNGEIGEVVYISESSKKKKLTKYGLVEQAIVAAKKIKFKPATDDKGNPITVTKNVEYSFTIY